jgi:GTPase SAR1 family protein
MPPTPDAIEQRLNDLEKHLREENPILVKVVRSFRMLDRVAHDMGLLKKDQSFATQIPWWPLISVLGTFSAGKSTFINEYLGYKLQRTGNQAVDDRFTVIVYSPETTSQALPGMSLDSDPRFPFYQISADIEQVASGEGRRIDSYLQLKTCPCERLRGRILIDSPGFDADAQRTGILRITDHIMALSDLVLVFFDARHPEAGAMRDTLRHLVADTIKRPDSGKFLYILNQIDTAAREDNPEDVVAAWLRALGEEGLTAGRFYTIYNPGAAIPITDETTRKRFEAKRDEDLTEILKRMDGVETERAYRIIATLRKTATDFGERTAPLLQTAVARWRRRTLIADTFIFGMLIVLFLAWSISAGHWHGLSYQPAWLKPIEKIAWGIEGLEAVLVVVLLIIQLNIRRLAAMTVMPWLRKQVAKETYLAGDVLAAFRRNTQRWRTVFARYPAGWGPWSRNRVAKVLGDCEAYVQALNERFTKPTVTAEQEAEERQALPEAREAS